MSQTLPGPGDSATWEPYSGHPNDPRAPLDEDVWEDDDYYLLDSLTKDDEDPDNFKEKEE